MAGLDGWNVIFGKLYGTTYSVSYQGLVGFDRKGAGYFKEVGKVWFPVPAQRKLVIGSEVGIPGIFGKSHTTCVSYQGCIGR